MHGSRKIAQQTVGSYQQAAEANRATPSRRGNVICLDADCAEDVMVTADLHGNRENFATLLAIANLGTNQRRHLVLQEVCHGGPSSPDGRGCLSFVLLEEVARLKCQFPDRVHFILSNHELAELIDYPIRKGQRMLNLAFRSGLQQRYQEATDQVRLAQLDFLRSSPLAVRVCERIFISHSLPAALDCQPFDETIFDRPLEKVDFIEHSSLFNMVWGRDYRPQNAAEFARRVKAELLIHGHDPCRSGYHVPNDCQIILDCCTRPAAYVILPMATAKPLRQKDIVRRIQVLP